MANVPLVANPILPSVPDEPKNWDLDPDEQATMDAVWKWMKDISLQIKILLGSPQSSNSALTIPLVQPGFVVDFAGPVGAIPSGYLFCDGSQISQTQYPSLFAAIGTTWNTGGETAGNFRLPDLRSRTTIGQGPGNGTTLSARTLGSVAGEENHTLIIAEMPSHTHVDIGHVHSITDNGHAHGLPSTDDFDGGGGKRTVGPSPTVGGTVASTSSATTGILGTNSGSALNQNTGGGGSHNNMQPYAVMTKIIKF